MAPGSPRRSKKAKRPALVWLEFQDCAGCTESVLREPAPDVGQIVLETSPGVPRDSSWRGRPGGRSGRRAGRAEQKGRYLAVVEGAIPFRADGAYCTVGGRSALDIARRGVRQRRGDDGRRRVRVVRRLRRPRPTGAVGVQEAVPGTDVINLGGCPPNAANTVPSSCTT